jgi:hypothetical protein
MAQKNTLRGIALVATVVVSGCVSPTQQSDSSTQVIRSPSGAASAPLLARLCVNGCGLTPIGNNRTRVEMRQPNGPDKVAVIEWADGDGGVGDDGGSGSGVGEGSGGPGM